MRFSKVDLEREKQILPFIHLENGCYTNDFVPSEFAERWGVCTATVYQFAKKVRIHRGIHQPTISESRYNFTLTHPGYKRPKRNGSTVDKRCKPKKDTTTEPIMSMLEEATIAFNTAKRVPGMTVQIEQLEKENSLLKDQLSQRNEVIRSYQEAEHRLRLAMQNSR